MSLTNFAAFFGGRFLSAVLPAVAALLFAAAFVPAARANSALLAAAQNNNLAEVNRIISAASAATVSVSVNVNYRGRNDLTPLHYAASNGNLAIISVLLAAGATPDSESSIGSTPLHFAAARGYSDAINALVAARADVDKRDHNYWTPLHSAARAGELAAVNALVAAGADVDLRAANSFYTPLHMAANNNHRDVVAALVAAGTDLTLQDWRNRTAGRAAEIAGVATTPTTPAPTTPTVTVGAAAPDACQSNTAAREIYSYGALSLTINRGATNANRDLLAAINSGDLVQVCRLIAAGGANLNAVDSAGRTPLIAAAENADPTIIETLIEAGANADYKPTAGPYDTALIESIVYDNPFNALMLIGEGADVNLPDNDGFTPLMYAAQGGHTEVVAALLVANVSLNAVNNRGSTALNVAVAQGHTDIAMRLRDSGALLANQLPAGNSGGGGGGGFLYAGAGLAGLALLWFLTSPDKVGQASFSPNYYYLAGENGYAYSLGGRWSYAAENWRLWGAGTQVNRNGNFGEFRYSTGAEYNGGFWSAALSETVQGKTTDYNFSLSAKASGGNWQISPVYQLRTRFANLRESWKGETQNSLNLQGVLRYRKWQLKSAAGFQWQNPAHFGKNTTANLSAIYRF